MLQREESLLYKRGSAVLVGIIECHGGPACLHCTSRALKVSQLMPEYCGHGIMRNRTSVLHFVGFEIRNKGFWF